MRSFYFWSLAFLIWIGTSSTVSAKPWDVDYSKSQLGFVGKQGDQPFDGSFSKYQVTIDFDLDHPEKGQIAATIDMASATAGSADRDGYLPQSDWFNTSQFPAAQFVSSSLHKVGPDAYEAVGTLTIKGITKPLTLPFTLKQEGDRWRAYGKVTLLRQDYHVGEHDWASEDQVRFGVDVTINLAVKPKS